MQRVRVAGEHLRGKWRAEPRDAAGAKNVKPYRTLRNDLMNVNLMNVTREGGSGSGGEDGNE